MPSGFIGSTPQATCHPKRKMHCKGLCERCYYNITRSEYNKSYQLEYNKANPESKKRGHLKPLGWTLELFNKVWEEQKGKCAICSKDLNLDKKQNASRACADHEHCEPPKPRGIVCINCNTMLGQSKDNPNILRAGALYLKKFLSVTTEEVKLIAST